MKKMLCLAVFALGLATPAVAEDWVWVDIDNSNGDPYVIFGDADSRTDNSAWFEARFTKPQKSGNGKFYNIVKILGEVDCRGKRSRLVTAMAYSKSGKFIDSDTPSYAKWNYVIPGTSEESAYKFVCNRYPR
mgnify:CR=1 FL=1